MNGRVLSTRRNAVVFSTINLTGWPLALILSLTVLTGAGNNADRPAEETPMTEKKLAEILNEQTQALMSLPGVVGTALGSCDGEPCIKVYVVQRTPALDRSIFDRLSGYPVQIEETGEIRAFPKNRN